LNRERGAKFGGCLTSPSNVEYGVLFGSAATPLRFVAWCTLRRVPLVSFHGAVCLRRSILYLPKSCHEVPSGLENLERSIRVQKSY
jgi:hypothetical protein